MNNQIKTTLRTLWRNKVFTVLNILGLSVGLGACLILYLLVCFELSYDNYHTKKDRIYRVASAYHGGSEGEHYFQGVPAPLPGALRQEFHQFEKVAAVDGIIDAQFTIPQKGSEDLKVKENKGVFYAEPSLFDILDQPWLAGNPATALANPHSVALDMTVANAWFGDWKEAIGKTIVLDHKTPLIVTGILTDPPGNTDMPMRIVVSFATYPGKDYTNWHNTEGNFNCYALLGRGENIRNVEKGITQFAAKYYDNNAPGEKTSFYFQPLKDIHSDLRMGSFSGKKTPVGLLWGLGLIGGFLLLIACINFINLATAQSVQRSREIGVRKVLGSSRARLILQFLGETAAISFIALLLACVFAELALPYFRNLVSEPIELNFWKSPALFLFLATAGVGVTLLGGLYPAFIISGFDPVLALKSSTGKKAGRGLLLRRGLVVFQFTIAQAMMIGTLIVMQQINFLKQLPMGFEKNYVAIIALPTDSLSRQHYAFVKSKIMAIPGVEAASLCSDAPTARRTITSSFSFEGKEPEFGLSVRKVDADYFRTFRLGLVAGRLPFASDSTREYLLNETAVHKLGFQHVDSVLGKILEMDAHAPVVGVVRDFSSGTPMSMVPPLVLSTQLNSYQYIGVRFDPREMQSVMKQVKAAWEGVFPEFAYEQQFLDETIAQYFTALDAAETLMRVFAAIALVVSCLGLYGLVAFMVSQRTKEVGIRKVLGASVQNILVLFSREFTILIGIAFLVAMPLGYYLMHMALEKFYNRIAIGWSVFAWVLGASCLIAWMTVGYRALRAALADPAQSLRTE